MSGEQPGLSLVESGRVKSRVEDSTDLAMFVRLSDDKLRGWDRDRIVDALLQETKIDRDTAELVGREVEEFIQQTKIKYVSAPLVREIVNAKLRVIGILESPRLKKKETVGKVEAREYRRVFYEKENEWFDVAVYDRSALGSEVAGPAIIEQYDSTSVIYPDWSFRPDDYGNLLLRRRDN